MPLAAGTKLTCVVGVDAGPAEADPGDGVVKLADGRALGSHVRSPLAAQALEEVGVLVEVAPQVQPEAQVVDASEAGLEVLVPQHLCSSVASETLGWVSSSSDSNSDAHWWCGIQNKAFKQGSCMFVKGRVLSGAVPGMSGFARSVNSWGFH